MTTPLGELRSREVFNLPDGVTKRIHFGGVRVIDSTTGQIVFLQGPVDLVKYHGLKFSGINPRTGLMWENDGLSLLVIREAGNPIEMFWNLVSKRAIGNLHGDLESGEYLKIDYEVTGVGAPPDTKYQIKRIPLT